MSAAEAYKRDREKNAERLRLLVGASKVGPAPVPIEPVAKPKKVSKPRAKRPAEEQIYSSRRTSTRLTAYGDDGAVLSREEKEAALELKIERDLMEEVSRQAQRAAIKHSIRPVIPLHSVTGSGSEANLRSLFASLASVPAASTSTTSFEDTTESRKLFDAEAKAYQIKGLVKVVPNRVYCLAVHPSMEKDVVFVGDKKGCIGVWDRTDYSKVDNNKEEKEVTKKEVKSEVKTEDDEVVVKKEKKTKVKTEVKDEEDEDMKDEEEEEGEGMEEDLAVSDARGKGRWYYWQSHLENSVSCIGFRPNEPGAVYSSAYDCTIRKTDFLTFESEEIINGDAFGSDILIHAFSFTADGNEIWASDTDGGIIYRDLREPIETARRWVIDPTGHKIGCISINPVNPYLACTAHLKKAMNLWDLRKLKGMPSDASAAKIRSNCLVAHYTTSKACTSAYFDATGTKVLAASYDDRLRIWELDPTNLKSIPDQFEPVTTMKHDCQSGAYLTVIKAQWLPSQTCPSSILVGNMKQFISIYSTGVNENGKGKLLINLTGEGVTSVPAVTGSHPIKKGRIYGATAAGKVVCYS